jgi:hypothetical protein
MLDVLILKLICKGISNMVQEISPTIFVSYSWDSEEHCKWVTKLACVLKENGVEALIDRYEVFPGSNLEEYMKLGLSNSRKVICICTDNYIAKMNDPETGVGKESIIINTLQRNEFVIPVIRNNSRKLLPESLRGKFYISFDEGSYDEKVEYLLRIIYGIPRELVPFKGSNPFNKEIVHQRIIEAEIQASTYISPDLEGIISFDYSNNNGQYTIGTGFFSFTTYWSKASNTSIHVVSDARNIEKIALVKSLGRIDELLSTSGLDFTSRLRTPKTGDAVVWINTSGNIAVTKILCIQDDSRGDESNKLELEYRIFTKPI